MRTTDRVIGPGQRVTNEEALRMLTVSGARLTFEENVNGRLVPGYLADLAVLSHDPAAVPAADLRAIDVSLTMAGGQVVHGRA